MLKRLRRRVTQYRPATGANSASGGSAAWFACGSMSRALALDGALLPDGNKRAALVDSIAFVPPPNICPGHPRQRVGARNGAARGSSATCS